MIEEREARIPSSLGGAIRSGPTTDAEIHRKAAAAWHIMGIVMIPVDELSDDDAWFRQAAINYATKKFGPRGGEKDGKKA